MKVSLAMATYNGEKYLQEQLDSILFQTHLPDELIITDDCSTEKTLEILENFIKSAPFEVRCYRNDKTLGYARNFSNAMCKTTGDLIFLCDQDDYWYKDKIEHVCNVALESDKKVFLNNGFYADECLNILGPELFKSNLGKHIERPRFVLGCCCAIQKDFLNTFLPIPHCFSGHDRWLVENAILFREVEYITKHLQLYRNHQNNASLSEVKTETIWELINKNFLPSLKQQYSNKKIMIEFFKDFDWESTSLTLPKEEVFSALITKKKALEYRINALSQSNRIPAFIDILSLYSKGEYKEFQGTKTMLRDLFHKIIKG